MTGGTGNVYGLRRLHSPARYNTMVSRSSGPRLRTWPSRVQDVEANDYAARHGCPAQSLCSFPGCPAAWPFPVNTACPCPCPDSPSPVLPACPCPCAARGLPSAAWLPWLLLFGNTRLFGGHCEGGDTRHAIAAHHGREREGEGGKAAQAVRGATMAQSNWEADKM